MIKLKLFIGFWVANSLVVYGSTLVAPESFVLGNAYVTSIWAAMAAGLVMTILVTMGAMFKPVVDLMDDSLKDRGMTLGYFWLVNIVAIWVTARMAGVFGFGVAKFYWVGLLAVVTDVVQWGVWEITNSKNQITNNPKSLN